jgi:hypothetical protein
VTSSNEVSKQSLKDEFKEPYPSTGCKEKSL